jgi:sarcosine oxidase subunit alpha
MPNARTPVARTPLHHWHPAHAAHFAERDGWQVVTAYSAVEREVVAARAGLGLADISAWAKISLRGPGVPKLVEALDPQGPARRPLGVSALADVPALACRLTEDHLILLGSAISLTLGPRLDRLLQDPAILRTDGTSAWAGFAVMGTSLDDFLRRLTHLDVRASRFPVGSCAETSLAGVEALLVRSAETSLPSMRVYVGWDFGEYVWERMMEAGEEWTITPVGMEALGFLVKGPAA